MRTSIELQIRPPDRYAEQYWPTPDEAVSCLNNFLAAFTKAATVLTQQSVGATYGTPAIRPAKFVHPTQDPIVAMEIHANIDHEELEKLLINIYLYLYQAGELNTETNIVEYDQAAQRATSDPVLVSAALNISDETGESSKPRIILTLPPTIFNLMIPDGAESDAILSRVSNLWNYHVETVYKVPGHAKVQDVPMINISGVNVPTASIAHCVENAIATLQHIQDIIMEGQE